MVKRVLSITAAATLSLGLAGCFQPLYGPNLSGPASAIGRIAVEQMPEHLGHQLKSELDFQLNNGTPPAQPLYRLAVQPRGNSGAIVADTAASRPQVMSYIATAQYTLTDIKSGKVITTGQAQVQASYDRDLQRFATVRALRDAEIRAATQLAEQIKNRVMPSLAKLQD